MLKLLRDKKSWDQRVIDGQSTEIQKDLMSYTIDITTHLEFGYDGNTLEQENNLIQQHLEKIISNDQSAD